MSVTSRLDTFGDHTALWVTGLLARLSARLGVGNTWVIRHTAVVGRTTSSCGACGQTMAPERLWCPNPKCGTPIFFVADGLGQAEMMAYYLSYHGRWPRHQFVGSAVEAPRRTPADPVFRIGQRWQ